VHQGKIYDYLGMNLDFSLPGKVAVKMDKYASNILDEICDEMPGHAATPATAHLFTICPDSERQLLTVLQAKWFHHIVAQLLFLCK
jgi:hypothetical protein